MTRFAVALLSLLTVLPAGLAIPASNHYLDHDLSSFQDVKHHRHHKHHGHCHNATTSAVSTTVATTEAQSTATESISLASSTTIVTSASSKATSLASTSSSVSTSTVSATTSSSTVKATPTSSSTIASASSTSSATSSGTSNTDINAYLIAHNSVRKQHGAANLQWNETLAAAAQKWVGGCAMKHSNGTLGPYGENLAAGAGGGYNITSGVVSWTNEASSFDPKNPQPSHFTQVVWKSTTQVGCASKSCDGIFDPKFGKAVFVTCEYYPPGNVAGQYAANVQA